MPSAESEFQNSFPTFTTFYHRYQTTLFESYSWNHSVVFLWQNMVHMNHHMLGQLCQKRRIFKKFYVWVWIIDSFHSKPMHMSGSATHPALQLTRIPLTFTPHWLPYSGQGILRLPYLLIWDQSDLFTWPLFRHFVSPFCFFLNLVACISDHLNVFVHILEHHTVNHLSSLSFILDWQASCDI